MPHLANLSDPFTYSKQSLKSSPIHDVCQMPLTVHYWQRCKCILSAALIRYLFTAYWHFIDFYHEMNNNITRKKIKIKGLCCFKNLRYCFAVSSHHATLVNLLTVARGTSSSCENTASLSEVPFTSPGVSQHISPIAPGLEAAALLPLRVFWWLVKHLIP